MASLAFVLSLNNEKTITCSSDFVNKAGEYKKRLLKEQQLLGNAKPDVVIQNLRDWMLSIDNYLSFCFSDDKALDCCSPPGFNASVLSSITEV